MTRGSSGAAIASRSFRRSARRGDRRVSGRGPARPRPGLSGTPRSNSDRRDDRADGEDRRGDRERGRVAVDRGLGDQRRRRARAGEHARRGARRERREQRGADRAADLLAGVDRRRGDAGVVRVARRASRCSSTLEITRPSPTPISSSAGQDVGDVARAQARAGSGSTCRPRRAASRRRRAIRGPNRARSFVLPITAETMTTAVIGRNASPVVTGE